MSTVMHHTSKLTLNIELTDTAKKHMLSDLAKHPGHVGLRLTLEKKGCSGLAYVLDYVKNPNTEDPNIPLSDEYLLYIDKSKFLILQNLKIDYIKQGLNYKLVFTNPNQTGQCGCGESFTVN